MKKRITILLLCLVFIGVGLAIWNVTRYDRYYDDNAALARESDSFHTTEYIGSHDGDRRYTLSISTLTGAKTIWRYGAQAGEQEVTLSCTLEELGAGTAKLVLIAPDDTVTTIAEASCTTQQVKYTFPTQKGVYRLKLVGKDDAKIRAQLSYSHGTS